jgi:uncharacterized membrane protein
VTAPRSASALALASLLAAAGASHFLATDAYARIVPRSLGHPELWVYVSGVAELACAGGLVAPATRRVAALATAGLLVAVFPANVQMARDADGRSTTYRAVVYARLPVQVPLVLWALAVAGTASRRDEHQARPSSR